MNTYKQISIAILCGGWSKEREISLLSGTTTYNCLKDNGYNVLFLDMKENDKKVLSNFIEKNCFFFLSVIIQTSLYFKE